MNKYSALLFDLDGTLLDTLADLHASCCYALKQKGYPARTLDEVRLFVGNGVAKLMERAVPASTSAEDIEEALAVFRAHYKEHSRIRTAPYPGIDDALRQLYAEGYKMAVISNKFDAAVRDLNRDFFSAYIPVSIGDREGRRKKPAPDSLFDAMEQLGVRVQDCLYIGDSDVDIETAAAAGIPCIGCAWGFRGRNFLKAHGLADDWILDTPSELPDWIAAHNPEI